MRDEPTNPVHAVTRNQLRMLLEEFHAADTEAERTAIMARLMEGTRALASGKGARSDH